MEVSMKRAAEILGISRHAIRAKLKRGELKGRSIGDGSCKRWLVTIPGDASVEVEAVVGETDTRNDPTIPTPGWRGVEPCLIIKLKGSSPGKDKELTWWF
ncbi:MAG: hypothetical protein DDT32_01873 [Syntrophomonadaceae bacterium]|nr:hypothetical protein [Bacillota bacterium]